MPRSRELVVIFSLLLLTFGVRFAQLTANTNAPSDADAPFLRRHPEFLHAGIAAFCLLLGWSTTLSSRVVDRLLSQKVAWFLLLIGLVFLAQSLFLEQTRWISIGGLKFQASEPLKLSQTLFHHGWHRPGRGHVRLLACAADLN